MQLVVALSGAVASGKSTVAKAILEQFLGMRLSTRTMILARTGCESEREALQEAGDRLDVETNFQWVADDTAAAARDAAEDSVIVVDGVVAGLGDYSAAPAMADQDHWPFHHVECATGRGDIVSERAGGVLYGDHRNALRGEEGNDALPAGSIGPCAMNQDHRGAGRRGIDHLKSTPAGAGGAGLLASTASDGGRARIVDFELVLASSAPS
ncbi:hypothetical protein HNP52_000048 [Sphingomonas kyeonggiensis]|uniref:Uncharacterized protein n=1 Tax=Sphingomonas kyeonggiensis TaxID=1268553 RepID=A0A7W7JXW5_9SPHN|nr:hypothetical protein [Sphingomonas kyeonggiensis]